MIVCPNCGKENQDHYKFCLGCGAKLPAPGQAAAPMPPPPPSVVPPPMAPSPPQYAPPAPAPQPAPQQQQQPQAYGAPPPAQVRAEPQAYGAPPAPAQQPQPYASPAAPPAPPHAKPPQPGPYGQSQQGTYGQPSGLSGGAGQPYGQAAPSSGPRSCPNCGTVNPPQFKFCGACGNNLEAAPTPPPAPTPAPQPNTSVGPAPTKSPPPAPPQNMAAPGPAVTPAAKTMFMDASQRPVMAGGIATIRLVLLREDGTEGGVLVIEGGPETIGRAHGPPFDSDAYLDPRHADLTATHEGLLIDASGSVNGVYLKLEGRTELQHRDFFRVGQELLLYEDLPEPTPTADGTERMGSPNPGYWGRVSVMVSPERIAAAYPVKSEGVEIGRENGEITFPDDGYVSGSHCRVFGDDDGVFLEDLGSSNGTYMRVRPGQLIRPGTLILIGQQLFRVELT